MKGPIMRAMALPMLNGKAVERGPNVESWWPIVPRLRVDSPAVLRVFGSIRGLSSFGDSPIRGGRWGAGHGVVGLVSYAVV